jgi:hypothetical protein
MKTTMKMDRGTGSVRRIIDNIHIIDGKLSILQQEKNQAHLLYETLKQHPDLLEQVEDLSTNTPAPTSWEEQESTLLSRRNTLVARGHELARKTQRAIEYKGWKCKSTSGGYGYTFDLEKLEQHVDLKMEHKGKPLLRREIKVDRGVWKKLVKAGEIDEEALIDAGIVTREPNTRRASFKPTGDN